MAVYFNTAAHEWVVFVWCPFGQPPIRSRKDTVMGKHFVVQEHAWRQLLCFLGMSLVQLGCFQLGSCCLHDAFTLAVACLKLYTFPVPVFCAHGRLGIESRVFPLEDHSVSESTMYVCVCVFVQSIGAHSIV